MRKIWLGAFSVFALSACSAHNTSIFSSLPSGVTLVENVPAQPGKTMIPYSKYRLANGLTVILSPDHSDPLVHVDVTYHVGSAREQVGKSGFAHFFEHMMFQGSEHVADQEHFRLITEAGGTLNGSTNRDSTNYFETVPANQLEKMLWLESDRMGYLLDAVSQRKFEIQRDTVKNERAQNFDNRPYGLMWEKMGEAMYPEGHPYSWQTIGYVDDLDRVNVNDLKAFFLRWYGPNNAVLTIGGDIDVKETLAWISKYFGPIPSGPDVAQAPKKVVKLASDRFVTMQDNIQQPMVLVGWPTQYLGAKSEKSLDMLANVLGSGANSLLYQKLVKTQQAVDAGAFQDCAELSCTFYVYAMAPAGERGQLAPLYQQLMTTLDEFKRTGVKQERLEQVTGMAEANAVFSLQSVRGKVTRLAANQTFFDQPDRIEQQLKEIHDVTPESVMAAYDHFLANQPKVTLSVVPKGQTQYQVAAPNFTAPERKLPEYQPIKDEELNYRRPKDSFDRSAVPEVAQSVAAQIPKLYELHFDNGIDLLGTQSSETPTVQLVIKLPAGERYVPQGKEGLAELTASLLEEGTSQHSLEQLEAKLSKLGSEISVDASNYTTSISVSSLDKNFAATLEIMQEMLFHPAFHQEDFARLKQQMLQNIVYQHQQPSWLASQAMRQVLYAGTVFERVQDGTTKSIQSLTLDDVKRFYAKYYTPKGAQIVVVGDSSKREIAKKLAFLSEWQGDEAPLLRPQMLPSLAQQKIYLIDKPDAPQSAIRFVRQGLPFDATGEVYLTQLANFNLAGNFNSRINQNLREDKGYTYGASGYLAANREVGAIIFSAQVRTDATAAAITEIKNEMAKYSQSGMTEKELKFLRLAVGQQDALKYETPSQKAQLLSSILTYSLDEDYLKQRNDIVESVSKQSLDEMATKWFNPNDYQIIVVGDVKTLKPQLEKLHIPMEGLEIIR